MGQGRSRRVVVSSDTVGGLFAAAALLLLLAIPAGVSRAADPDLPLVFPTRYYRIHTDLDRDLAFRDALLVARTLAQAFIHS